MYECRICFNLFPVDGECPLHPQNVYPSAYGYGSVPVSRPPAPAYPGSQAQRSGFHGLVTLVAFAALLIIGNGCAQAVHGLLDLLPH